MHAYTTQAELVADEYFSLERRIDIDVSLIFDLCYKKYKGNDHF